LDVNVVYQLVIAAGLVVFVFNLLLNLRSLKRPQANGELPASPPLVSVLIPARDEEPNIEACLRSLQQQDYPNFEIIVLNDNSVDNTASIVAQMAAEDHRVQIIDGEPLAPGWAGKPFACHQLAQQARGSWLLFVDADTTHSQDMLRRVIAMALGFGSSLLSGFPRQQAQSLPQKIAIPMIYFIILSWFPLWWLQRSKRPKPSLAIGQFLLFCREDYWRIGGHEAVKSRILEDVWLGIEITRSGGRHVTVDLSPVVYCNMYRSIGAMWEGLVRSIYSVAALSVLALAALLAVGFFFFLAPFYWLWNGFYMVAAPVDWRAVVISQCVIILVMRWLVDSRFKEPVISLILHPVGISFLIVSCCSAMVRRVTGAGVQWKKRVYSQESCIE